MLQTSEQPKYMKQQLAELKKKIDSNKIVEDFNIPFSLMVEQLERKSIRIWWA